MNSATWILIGESFLILVSLIIVIAVYAWRKKRRLLAALDVLLTNLSKVESERKTTLTERLKNSCQLDEVKANLLTDEIFCAERQFIQKLIQLLLNSGSDKIAGFNEDIYALVTPYWELLPLDQVANGPPAEQGEGPAAIPPVSPESESGDLSSEGFELDVSVATTAEEDSETDSTSTLTEATPDIEIDEDKVVVSSEVADQSIPTEDLNESDQSEESNQSIPASSVEELVTDKGADNNSVSSPQDEPKQKSESMEPDDSENYESFVADIVEEECLAEETTDSVEAEEDEPSWDEAFDEAAQEQDVRAVNLDEKD